MERKSESPKNLLKVVSVPTMEQARQEFELTLGGSVVPGTKERDWAEKVSKGEVKLNG